MDSNPKSPVDKLIGVCLHLLVGAVAVFIAVKLIEAVWTALLVIVVVGLFVGASVLVLQSRRGGW